LNIYKKYECFANEFLGIGRKVGGDEPEITKKLNSPQKRYLQKNKNFLDHRNELSRK
jgi:hypothetical protein